VYKQMNSNTVALLGGLWAIMGTGLVDGFKGDMRTALVLYHARVSPVSMVGRSGMPNVACIAGRQFLDASTGSQAPTGTRCAPRSQVLSHPKVPSRWRDVDVQVSASLSASMAGLTYL